MVAPRDWDEVFFLGFFGHPKETRGKGMLGKWGSSTLILLIIYPQRLPSGLVLTDILREHLESFLLRSAILLGGLLTFSIC